MDFDRFWVSRGHQKWDVFEDGDQQICMIFDMFCDFLRVCEEWDHIAKYVFLSIVVSKSHPAVDKVLKFIITGWGEFPKVVNPSL